MATSMTTIRLQQQKQQPWQQHWQQQQQLLQQQQNFKCNRTNVVAFVVTVADFSFFICKVHEN